MLVREKGKKDATPVGMGWDEAQAAILAGTHEPAEGEQVDEVRSVAEPDYEAMTRHELDDLAKERGVDVSAAKNKGDVIEALRKAA